jgi:pimeloyl-ACP methyl ester carboxylesterase
LYLHGNAGALDSWGDIAGFYTNLGYDIIIPDYRGFGKSTGKINSMQQFFDDVQRVYNQLKQNYSENRIVVIGYSIGTGPATYLAAKNNPQKLALLAPYYSLPDLMHVHYKIIPGFVLKYQFMTNEYIQKVKAPIALFHGNNDELIYYKSSEKLIKLCKPSDTLYILPNQAHGGVNENPEFRNYFKKFIDE